MISRLPYSGRSALAVFVLFLIANAGCAGSSGMQRVIDGYDEEANRRGKARVMVLPLGNHLARTLEGAQSVRLNSRAEETFYDYFGPALGKATTARVQQADPSFAPQNLPLVYRSFSLDDASLTTLAPRDSAAGQLTLADGTTPDFLLFVDDLTIDAETQSSGDRYASGMQEKMVLKGALKYVLWDNQTQQVAAYGRVNEDSLTTPSLPGRTYRNLFEQLIGEMVPSMPLAPAGSIS